MKDTLIRIDETFERVDFAYRPKGGAWKQVATLEELDYPATYHSLDKVPWEGDKSGILANDELEMSVQADRHAAEAPVDASVVPAEVETAPAAQSQPKPAVRKPGAGHIALRENQRGVSYEALWCLLGWGAER